MSIAERIFNTHLLRALPHMFYATDVIDCRKYRLDEWPRFRKVEPNKCPGRGGGDPTPIEIRFAARIAFKHKRALCFAYVRAIPSNDTLQSEFSKTALSIKRERKTRRRTVIERKSEIRLIENRAFARKFDICVPTRTRL